MWERLESYFFSEPERLIGLGRALLTFGGWLIICALYGQVVTSVANGIGHFGGHAVEVKTLADIYPSIPTWWVPESIICALPAIALMFIGIWLSIEGKRIRRFIGRRG